MRIFSFRTIHFTALLAAVLIVQIAAPQTASAQDTIGIVLSLPGNYRDIVTTDSLAAFEAQYGVRVHIEYGEGGRFFGGGGQSSLDEQLDAASTLASSADVVYVDQSTLTPEGTQAGYFLNLAPLANSDSTLQVNDFYPAVWQSFQWDQGIWALPTSADIILVTYDPAVFDAAGLAYPTDRWTLDDFANASRVLTTYNADGSVLTAGLTAGTPTSTLPYLLRALTGSGFYDSTVSPNTPSFSDPNLASLLETWQVLVDEGVVTTSFFRGGGDQGDSSPLRIEGTFGFAGRFDNSDTVRSASLLPGGTAGMSAEGFAVSSGTRYPEMSYALARYLTALPELATSNFTSATPARQSMAGVQASNSNNSDTQQGGGPGRGGNRFLSVPDQIRAVIDQALFTALPGSEVRYASYLTTALNSMNSGLDAQSALQEVEAAAIADAQAAVARRSSTSVIVVTPPPQIVLSSAEIALNCAYNTGFGGGPGGAQLPNENEWNQVLTLFAAGDPLVGEVTLEAVNESDIATLAESYDCFILPSNAVQGSDVSPLINLDPLLDTDSSFNRNDIMTGVLPQLQQDNKIWAMPLAIQPQMLSYNPTLLAQAGVPEPVNGWTTDAFIDALRQLDAILPEDTAAFTPNDPSGSYLMMLIGAFGGLPIDYRTNPPTLNFTDPNTINAIQQVLDLAKQGYFTYSSQANLGGGLRLSNDQTLAISTDTISRLARGFGGGQLPFGADMLQTLYPQGTSNGFVAFDITTGYISATTQSPEASYRFLSTVATHPELFSGMPVRRSLINDPAVVAAQGADAAAVYGQLDTLMQNPNTIVFPANSGLGGIASNFITEYWLKSAFDSYVLEDGDLATALEDAQALTSAYLDCMAAAGPSTAIGDDLFGGFEQIQDCAMTVDPTMSLPGGGN